MIRIRARRKQSGLSAVDGVALKPAGTASMAMPSLRSTAHAIGVGSRVLLFGAIRPDGLPSEPSPRRRRLRKRRPIEDLDVPVVLRVRFTPRERWRRIEVRPDGTWIHRADTPLTGLRPLDHNVVLQIETPHGRSEQTLTIWQGDPSAGRPVVASLDAIRAEASYLHSKGTSSKTSVLTELLGRLPHRPERTPSWKEAAGSLVYLSEGLETVERDRKLLGRLRLPEGFVLPCDLFERGGHAVTLEAAALAALADLFPPETHLVWLTTSDAIPKPPADRVPASITARLDALLVWPGSGNEKPPAAPRTPPQSPRSRGGGVDGEPVEPLYVNSAAEATRLLSDRGLLASTPVETPPAGRRRRTRRRTTRYPLVLCHGLLAYSTLAMERFSLADYFFGVRAYLEEHGFTVWTPEVGRTQCIRDRAEQLRDAITRLTGGPVNLIGHSMGGLDARWLISRLDMADRVPVLVTVATPHHGSTFANWFLERAERRLPVLPVLEALGADMAGYRDVTPEACRRFNQEVLDAPGVTYYGYTASAPRQRISPVLRQGYDVIYRAEGPNDGMVSVVSAARGTVLGHLEADHFAQTGNGHFQQTFDHRAFFLRLATELARRGF